MEIKFTHLSIENFCGIKSLDTDLYDKTLVTGKNGVGKSTIKNAIYWVLFNKMADGSAPKEIRPHDANNVDVDHVEIIVELTMDVDGKKVALKKIQKQKWTKHHGTTEAVYEGNYNEFTVNDIPKTEKTYKEYIEDLISLDTFYESTSPIAFFGLDQKKRREKLLKLEKSVTKEEVIEANPQFLVLASDLKDGTVEELITRSKKVISAGNDELKSIPIKIGENERQKVEIDLAELELEKKALEERLEHTLKKKDNVQESAKEYNEANDELMKLQFERGDIQRKAAEEKSKEVDKARKKAMEASVTVTSVNDRIRTLSRQISDADSEISHCEKKKKDCAEEWKKQKALAFDEDSLICPYCKREYEAGKQEELRNGFEKAKESTLQKIVDEGNKYKAKICEATEEKETLSAQQEKLVEVLEASQLEMEEANAMYKLAQGKEIVMDSIEEYKVVEAKIAKLEEKIANMSDFDNLKKELIAEELEIRNELARVEKELSKADVNVLLDNRIAELEEKRKKTSQMVVSEQGKLDLLQEFNNTLMQTLSERVNKHFRILKFQLFEPLINGGTKECCKPLVNGTSYDGALNTGNKILANIDICSAFQKQNGIQLPIIVDDTESLDSDKVPNEGSQMILLRRVDDSELTVAEG